MGSGARQRPGKTHSLILCASCARICVVPNAPDSDYGISHGQSAKAKPSPGRKNCGNAYCDLRSYTDSLLIHPWPIRLLRWPLRPEVAPHRRPPALGHPPRPDTSHRNVNVGRRQPSPLAPGLLTRVTDLQCAQLSPQTWANSGDIGSRRTDRLDLSDRCTGDQPDANSEGSASASRGQPLAQIALAIIQGSCISMHCGSRRELTHLPHIGRGPDPGSGLAVGDLLNCRKSVRRSPAVWAGSRQAAANQQHRFGVGPDGLG